MLQITPDYTYYTYIYTAKFQALWWYTKDKHNES